MCTSEKCALRVAVGIIAGTTIAIVLGALLT